MWNRISIVPGNWIKYYELTLMALVYFQDFNERHEIPPSGSDGLPKPRLKKYELYDSLLFLIPSLRKRKSTSSALPEVPQVLNEWHCIVFVLCLRIVLQITCTYHYLVIHHDYLLNLTVIFYSHYSNFLHNYFMKPMHNCLQVLCLEVNFSASFQKDTTYTIRPSLVPL